MSRVQPKAVALGVLTDLGGSILSGVAFGVLLAVLLIATGNFDPDQLAELDEALWMQAAGYFLGIAFSILGGFVAGRVARESEVLHGGVTGLVSALLGLLLAFTSPLWYVVLAFVSVPPAAMLGGHLSRRRAPVALPPDRPVAP